MTCNLATDIRVAYEGHDREALERALSRVDVLAAMTKPCHMDPVQLGRRRVELQAELAAVDRELERRAEAASRQQQTDRDEWIRQNPTNKD